MRMRRSFLHSLEKISCKSQIESHHITKWYLTSKSASTLASATTQEEPNNNQHQTNHPNHHHHHHHHHRKIDMRSDTVTSPTPEMLNCVLNAPTGDDVYDEDPTVLELQEYAANLFGKEKALFVPTGTMSNLCAIISHCNNERASEIIIGSSSHLAIYEGGNVSNLGGVSSRNIMEHKDGTMDLEMIQDVAFR